MRILLYITCLLNLSLFSAQDTVKITFYNLLNFPAAQQDRIDTLKKVLDYIQPDIFVVNELTSFNGAGLIKNKNRIKKGSNIVCVLTGNGLKDPDCAIKNNDAIFQNNIEPSLREITKILGY